MAPRSTCRTGPPV